MTAETDLLPLPERFSFMEWETHMRDYARANVLHHTAAQAAEIEALRSDLADYMRIANTEATRAERLAEALRQIESAKGRGFGIDYARGAAQSALLDHDQQPAAVGSTEAGITPLPQPPAAQTRA